MARDISVSIAVDGEKEFSRALREAQSAVKVLDSELKASEAAYRNSGDAQQYLINKQKLLNDQLEQQQIIADKLADAVNDAAKEFGEATRETDSYRIAYNRARESMEKMQKELKDTDREMEELGRDSIRAGRQLDQGIGDAAEDAAKSLGDMYDELQTNIDDIKGLMGADLFGDLAGGAIEIAQGVNEFVEGTRESRRQLSYLEQNARSMNVPFEDVEDTLYHVAAITGDIEGAYEGVNNLINTGFNAQEIADAADLLVSAAIKLPETMKFEELASSLRETISTKSAVGQYAEMLEQMGVDLDVVNKALEKTATDEAAQDVALSFLSNRGLEQHLAEYQVLNETMIASQDAVNQLDAAWARLGGTVETWMTPIINAVTATVDAIDDVLSGRAFQREREEQARIIEVIEEETGLYSQLAEINRQITELDVAGKYREADALIPKRDALMAQIAEAMAVIAEEERAAETAGEEVGRSTISGMTTAIEDETPALVAATADAVDGLNTEFGRVTVPDVAGTWESQINRLRAVPVTTGGPGVNTRQVSSLNETKTINLKVNDRTVASAFLPAWDELFGREIALT